MIITPTCHKHKLFLFFVFSNKYSYLSAAIKRQVHTFEYFICSRAKAALCEHLCEEICNQFLLLFIYKVIFLLNRGNFNAANVITYTKNATKN